MIWLVHLLRLLLVAAAVWGIHWLPIPRSIKMLLTVAIAALAMIYLIVIVDVWVRDNF